MEHWLIPLGSPQGDAALDWAARHAGRRAALEVVVSGLEIPDPRAAVLHAAAFLEATCPRVPRALHAVPYSLVEELTRCDSVDLVVLGSPAGPLDGAATDRLLSLLRVCPSPAVLVPAGGAAASEPRDVMWSAAGRRPPAGLRAAVRSGREILRIVRTTVPPARRHGE